MIGRLDPRTGDPVPADEVREALDRVLSRRDFDSEPSMLSRLLDWMFEHLLPDLGPGTGAVLEQVLLALGGIALLVLLVLLVRLLVLRARLRRRGAEDPARTLVRTRVSELRSLAAAARRDGDDALALRYLLFALVVGLGQRGDLRYRDSWTNRELMERGEPSKDVRALLSPLIAELEAKEFGREPVLPADVERLEALCERWLGREARP
ncbi:MAG: hypothetical protein AAF682_24695 [Planctomycetota bacterium]